jgi:hypothetical protein
MEDSNVGKPHGIIVLFQPAGLNSIDARHGRRVRPAVEWDRGKGIFVLKDANERPETGQQITADV